MTRKKRKTKHPERNARLKLKRLPPELWAEAIENIADENLRIQIACLVWWDYFGGRTKKDAWHHLDKYLLLWNPALPSLLKSVKLNALISVGYTPKLAKERLLLLPEDPKMLTSLSCEENQSEPDFQNHQLEQSIEVNVTADLSDEKTLSSETSECSPGGQNDQTYQTAPEPML